MTGRTVVTASVVLLVVAAGCGRVHAGVGGGGGPVPPAGATVGAAIPDPRTITDGEPGGGVSVDSGRVATGWVASTGDLLSVGPIARRLFLADHVAAGSLAAMDAGVERDLGRLAERLPIPAGELRLVEVPLTVTTRVVGDGAEVRVWSVVVFGAETLGAPQAVWRTRDVTLVRDTGRWVVTGDTSTDGPTPVSGDELPAGWAEFATVTDWTPTVEGLS